MRVSFSFTERKWKILALLLVMLAIVTYLMFGCQLVQKPVTNPVCDRLEFAGSYICEKAHENGIEVEQPYLMILDARDIGLILDKFSANDVNRVCDKVIEYTEGLNPTYAGLLELLKVETAKAEAISGILTRHYGVFWSPLTMVAPDLALIRYGAEQLKIETTLNLSCTEVRANHLWL